MPLLLTPANDSADLRDRLARLRSQLRRSILVRGIGALAAGWLAIFIVVGFADRYAEIPSILRAVFLVAALIGTAVFIRRAILAPWSASGDDLHLAWRIEQRYPELNDALASAIDFNRSADFGAAGLRAATYRHAAREVADRDIDSVGESKHVWSIGAAFLAISAATATLSVISPSRSLTALLRIADPFGDHPWPPDTQLTVHAPDWLARGEPFVVRGELAGVVPHRAQLRLHADGSAADSVTLPVTETDSGGDFAVRIEPNRVSRTFRYQVSANDAITPWRKVTVFTPPDLIDRDGRPSPQIHLEFPSYTGQSEVELPDGGLVIEGVTGTQARIRAAVDRPIVRASIGLLDGSPVPFSVAAASLGSVIAVDAVSRLANTIAVSGPIAGFVEPGGLLFEFQFVPPMSGRYVLQFEDASGLIGRRELDVRLSVDPSPTVSLDRPSAGRESLSVLADAAIPLAARIDDPVFAVRTAWLEYRTPTNGTWNRMPISLPTKTRRPSQSIETTWNLQSVRLADGRPLQDGDIVTIAVAADDFDNVTTTKPAGRSHEVELRIVSPAGLRAILQKSQAEIQRELAAMKDMQRSAREKTDVAKGRRMQSGEMQKDDADRLAEAAQIQQQLRQRIGNEQEGLRGAAEQLRQTLRNNPLNDASAERDRAESLSAELERLLREEVDPVEPLLAAARAERGPIPPQDRKASPLAQANRMQKDAERTLQDLHQRMQAWSEARELRAEAANLERDQERLMRQREQLESQPEVRGADASRLRADQREALSRLAERQSALAERGNELAQKLNQRASEKQAEQAEANSRSGAEASDQAELLKKQAQSLIKARDQAQDSPGLNAVLNEATQSLSSNKLGEAKSAQAAAVEKLRKIQDALAESPERDVERLAKRLADMDREIDQLLDDQERLLKQSVELESISDPAAKKEAMEKLAREQDSLRQRTEELAQRLSRMQQDSAAQDLRRSVRSMEQARESIEQGESPAEKQDQALDRLEDAQEQVELERQRLKDELQREQMARLLDAIRGFSTRQNALNAESQRVFQAARADQSWSRALLKSLIDLADAERSLGVEVQRFSDEKSNEARVVAHLLRETVDAMSGIGAAVESARNGPMDMETWDADRRLVQSPQQLATRRLVQLLETMQESEEEQRDQRSRTRNEQRPGEPGAAPLGDGIPDIVQLKLLRTLQAELNEQTNAFANEHPDPEKWTAAERDKISKLQKSQAELAALLEGLTSTEPPREEKKP